MGLISVNEAVKALRDAGLRAGRGYPGSLMPQIGSLAVAVNVEEAQALSITFAARVCCPGDLGGPACEDGAAQVAAAWMGAGGDCRREHCSYDRDSDLFSVRVLGTWAEVQETESEPKPEMTAKVTLGGRVLEYVTAVRAEHPRKWRTGLGFMGEEPEQILESQGWTVTIEELLPSRAQAVEADAPFTVTVKEGGKVEKYADCVWMNICREDTAEGVRQKRVCHCWTRSVSDG